MTSPEEPAVEPDSGDGDKVEDEAERQAARVEQDTEGVPEDPREPREPPEPFSGSEH